MVAVILKTAVVPAQIVLLTGCVLITGSWPSVTVTVNVQVDELPHTSVAVTITGVVPMVNTEPDAGTEVIVITPPQLSVAIGEKVTTAVHAPAGVGIVLFAGQVSVGGVISFTVIVCVQVAEFPAASVAR